MMAPRFACLRLASFVESVGVNSDSDSGVCSGVVFKSSFEVIGGLLVSAFDVLVAMLSVDEFGVLVDDLDGGLGLVVLLVFCSCEAGLAAPERGSVWVRVCEFVPVSGEGIGSNEENGLFGSDLLNPLSPCWPFCPNIEPIRFELSAIFLL